MPVGNGIAIVGVSDCCSHIFKMCLHSLHQGLIVYDAVATACGPVNLGLQVALSRSTELEADKLARFLTLVVCTNVVTADRERKSSDC